MDAPFPLFDFLVRFRARERENAESAAPATAGDLPLANDALCTAALPGAAANNEPLS